MGSTSADREVFRKLILKYPIIAINGFEGGCVDKILEGKGFMALESLNIMEVTDEEK